MRSIPSTWLHTKQVGRQIAYFEEIDSTNLEAKRNQERVDGHGMVFLAEQQNQGRGRMGRNWVSPKGTGVWMSILLKPEFPTTQASQVTLIAALAVADAIKKVAGLEGMIKWPNDIVVNRKKVCGILTEMGVIEDKIQYLVVGIGINVNTEEFPEEIRATATSLKIEGDKVIERECLVAEILNSFELYYEHFCTDGDLSRLTKYYNSILINKGKKVKIVGNLKEDSFIGEAIGIDELGRLLVRLEDGTIEIIVSGEVSVRGLYGYV